jgi:hypothetical protein
VPKGFNGNVHCKGGTRGHDSEDKATNQRRTPTNVEDTSAENLNDVRDKNSRVCV